MSEIITQGYVQLDEDENNSTGSFINDFDDSIYQNSAVKSIEYIVKETYVDDLADEVLGLTVQEKLQISQRADDIYQNFKTDFLEQARQINKFNGLTDAEIDQKAVGLLYDKLIINLANQKSNLVQDVTDLSDLIDQPNLTSDEIIDFMDQKALDNVSFDAIDNLPSTSDFDSNASQSLDDFLTINKGVSVDDIITPTRLPSTFTTTGKILLKEVSGMAGVFNLLGFGLGVASDIYFDNESAEQAFWSNVAGSAAGIAAAVGVAAAAGPIGLSAGAALGIGFVLSSALSFGADEAVDWGYKYKEQDNSIDIKTTEEPGSEELNRVLSTSVKIVGGDGFSSVGVETPTKTLDITKDQANNTLNVTSTGETAANEVANIVDSLLINNPAIDQLNLNDPVNQFMAERGVDGGINIDVINGNETDLAKVWISDGSAFAGEDTLNISIVGNQYNYDIQQNGATGQKTLTTNNDNMNQLGILMEEGTFDGSDVTVVSNGKTITGQQQNGETVVDSTDLTQTEIEQVQVGFVDSVAAKAVDIAANVFGMILDPFSGLLGIANSVLSQVTSFLGNILNSIFGAYYEDGTLTYDESLSIADKTGELLISKTELINMDENGNDDGIISAADDVGFDNLQIWQDINEDGIADAGEIKSLSDAGIIAINTEDVDLYTSGNAASLSSSVDHNWYISQSYRITKNVGIYTHIWDFPANTIKLFDNGNTVVGTHGNDDLPHIYTIGAQSYTEDFYPTNYICGSGDDIVTANHRNNKIYGGTGNDNLSGQEGNDLILGEDGNDNTTGGVGNDTIYGGEGDDLIIGMNPDFWIDSTTGDQYPATQDLEPGETDDDKLYGGAGSDTILGRAGNDYIDGGAGADSMEGGDGDDVYIVNTVNDILLEHQNEGHDKVFSNVTYLLNSEVEDLKLIGDKNIHGTGNKLDNKIIGNSEDNILDGVTGADTMIGQTGDDTYYVDNSNDIIVEKANEGNDTVQTSISYALSENIENLNLLSFSTPEKGLIDGKMVHVYGYPKQYELDYMQGDKNPEYRGTCALTAISNLFIQSGGNYTEEDIVNYAVQNNLTVTEAESDDPLERGGTSAQLS